MIIATNVSTLPEDALLGRHVFEGSSEFSESEIGLLLADYFSLGQLLQCWEKVSVIDAYQVLQILTVF